MDTTGDRPAQLLDSLTGLRPEWMRPEAARRYRCVWMRLALGCSAPEIARELALSPSRVRHIHSEFFRDGVAAILGQEGWGGRRRALLSLEQERALLRDLAAGQRRLETRAVRQALEAAVGKPVDASTARDLLLRHGWRRSPSSAGTWLREDARPDRAAVRPA